jgi:predicted HD phosphohydrolase
MSVQLSSVDQIGELFLLGARVKQPSHAVAQSVDLVDHGLQCAELLASWFPEDIELQVAGLLHDLGHHLALADVDTIFDDEELLHGERGSELVPLCLDNGLVN